MFDSNNNFANRQESGERRMRMGIARTSWLTLALLGSSGCGTQIANESVSTSKLQLKVSNVGPVALDYGVPVGNLGQVALPQGFVAKHQNPAQCRQSAAA